MCAVAPYCDPSDVVAGTLTRDDGFVNPWDVHQWVCRRARAELTGTATVETVDIGALAPERFDQSTSAVVTLL